MGTPSAQKSACTCLLYIERKYQTALLPESPKYLCWRMAQVLPLFVSRDGKTAAQYVEVSPQPRLPTVQSSPCSSTKEINCSSFFGSLFFIRCTSEFEIGKHSQFVLRCLSAISNSVQV